jgi:hypothetical protein
LRNSLVTQVSTSGSSKQTISPTDKPVFRRHQFNSKHPPKHDEKMASKHVMEGLTPSTSPKRSLPSKSDQKAAEKHATKESTSSTLLKTQLPVQTVTETKASKPAHTEKDKSSHEKSTKEKTAQDNSRRFYNEAYSSNPSLWRSHYTICEDSPKSHQNLEISYSSSKHCEHGKASESTKSEAPRKSEMANEVQNIPDIPMIHLHDADFEEFSSSDRIAWNKMALRALRVRGKTIDNDALHAIVWQNIFQVMGSYTL